MFLNQLSHHQKEAFIELAHMVAKADGVVGPEEESLLSTYLFEMQMETGTYKAKGTSLVNILRQFLDIKGQRIIYIEIIALVHTDQDFSEEEKTIVKELELAFGIKDREREQIFEWLKRINQIYAEGYELVNA